MSVIIKTYFHGTVCLSCKTHSMKVDVVDGENWSRIRADDVFISILRMDTFSWMFDILKFLKCRGNLTFR